jgi:hypothetical protein
MRRVHKAHPVWLIAICLLVFLSNPTIAFPLEKKIVGLIEKVKICPGALEIMAKVDTGATHSSLDVSHIVEFERNNVRWVRFDVANHKGQKRTIEREIFRKTRIKRHKEKPASVYVVKLGICLGDHYREVEVNLADRTGFNYRMLIGRSFIKDVFIVDPSLRFTTRSSCNEPCRE